MSVNDLQRLDEYIYCNLVWESRVIREVVNGPVYISFMLLRHFFELFRCLGSLARFGALFWYLVLAISFYYFFCVSFSVMCWCSDIMCMCLMSNIWTDLIYCFVPLFQNAISAALFWFGVYLVFGLLFNELGCRACSLVCLVLCFSTVMPYRICALFQLWCT